MISASDDGIVKVWNFAAREAVRTFYAPKSEAGRPGAFRPLHKKRVMETPAAVQIEEVVESETLAQIHGMLGGGDAMAVTPDDQWAAVELPNKVLSLWSVNERKEVRALQGSERYHLPQAEVSNGKHVVCLSGGSSTVFVKESSSGRCICKFTGETNYVCCDIAPDSSTVVAGDASGGLHFFRLILSP